MPHCKSSSLPLAWATPSINAKSNPTNTTGSQPKKRSKIYPTIESATSTGDATITPTSSARAPKWSGLYLSPPCTKFLAPLLFAASPIAIDTSIFARTVFALNEASHCRVAALKSDVVATSCGRKSIARNDPAAAAVATVTKRSETPLSDNTCAFLDKLGPAETKTPACPFMLSAHAPATGSANKAACTAWLTCMYSFLKSLATAPKRSAFNPPA